MENVPPPGAESLSPLSGSLRLVRLGTPTRNTVEGGLLLAPHTETLTVGLPEQRQLARASRKLTHNEKFRMELCE